MEPLIELKGVVKEFRSVPPVRPLDGVSLAVAPGRIVAVTGVSGKGKSTLLNVMGGLLRADEGSVLYHGTDLARASAAEIDAVHRRGIGFVFQSPYLFPALTARENMVMALRAAGQNPATALVADGWVYVGSSGGGEVTAVNIADPSQVTSITVGKQPLGLCYDGAQGILYVGDYFASSIHLVDAQLKSLVKTVKLSASGYHNRTDPPDCCRIDPGTGRRTVALALAPEGNLLYCANYGTFDVARVDLATGEEIEAFDGVVGPRQILVSADGAQLLLAGVGGEGEQQVSDLYVLDRSSGKRVQEVPVGQSVAGVAQASDGSAVWAIARDDGELVAFDADWNETGRLSLGVGIDTLVLAPDAKTLLVGNSIGGQVHVVDAPSLALLNTIEGLASPKDIAVIA